MSYFSVKKPYTVLVGVILALILGVVSFTGMTPDLLPSISLPYVIVLTTYPGADPETVESTVTRPLEASMATVSNIVTVSSQSSENFSMLMLEFTETANMDSVSLEIRENIDQVKSGWDEMISSPIIMKLNPDMMPVMMSAIAVEGMDIAQTSAYVETVIVPELESVEGVASASASGLLEESINVVINQAKIDEINLLVQENIDQEFAEAEEDIRQSEQDIISGQKELEDGIQEIINGESDLEDGKTQLDAEQNKANVDLAVAKDQLLTAKIALEATKLDLTSSLNTMNMLYDSLSGVIELQSMYTRYQAATEVLNNPLSTEEEKLQANVEIENIKVQLLAYPELAEIILFLEQNTEIITMSAERLSSMDWTNLDQQASVGQVLQTVEVYANTAVEEVEQSMGTAMEGMSFEEFKAMTEAGIVEIDKQIATIDNGLLEIEKGQISAAIGFATAASEMALGEQQLASTKAELESALAQLEDAREQIEEGKKELEDARLDAYDSADMHQVITVEMVENLLMAQNFSMPAGYVVEDGNSYMIRVGDQPEDVEGMKALPLFYIPGPGMITLGDVAEVFVTDNSDTIYTNVNGSEGIMLSFQKQTGYATGEVCDAVAEKLDSLVVENPMINVVTLMDQGIYIDLVMDSIMTNILWGAALAVIVLLLFLKDLRPTIVVAVSIPISIVTTIVCMYFSNITLNIISLSGLTLGIGMLVDNSIVVIENIFRYRGLGYSKTEAAMKGAKEVGGAIMASTLTTICVFAPIIFTEGLTRQLFVDLGLTIGFSLLASLFVALTVVPALASKVLGKKETSKNGRVTTAIINVYGFLLEKSLKVKFLLIPVSFVLLAGSIYLAFSNGTEFMPTMESTQLTVTLSLPEGSDLEDTAEATDIFVDRALEITDIIDIGATIDSSNSLLGIGGASTDKTTIYVTTSEERSYSNQELSELLVACGEGLDASISVSSESMDMSAMTGSGISVQVRGREIDTLQEIALDLSTQLEEVEGLSELNNGIEDREEELRIIIDRDKAMEYGLTVAQIYGEIAMKIMSGDAATVLVAENKDYSVYVEYDADEALTRELMESISLEGTNEDRETVDILLSDIASFEDGYSLTTIQREDQTRYITVSAGIAEGYNIGLVAEEVSQIIADYPVKEGYELLMTGEDEMIQDAMDDMVLMLSLAIVFMYLIMVAQFQSLLSPFIIMFTIPLAFTGGFASLYLTGSPVSIIGMVGFVMLSGIIVNNGIVLIDYMNQLREQGMEKHVAIIEAGKTRLRPVIMTALTTILALSTMVFSQDMGSAMMKPMALVTIGGLLYGTLLTLFIIPCVYDLFIRAKKKEDLDE